MPLMECVIHFNKNYGFADYPTPWRSKLCSYLHAYTKSLTHRIEIDGASHEATISGLC